MAVSLFAQVNHTGSVELLDASDDNTQVLFQVDGIAAKKGDVAQSARETVFYKLFYEGVEGINDEKPLVTKPKNYYVENFFSKKNPALNRFVILEELKGAINKNTDGQYVGTYELTMNLKALVNALNKAGATDNPVVWAAPPQRRTVGIGAGKKDARTEQQPTQPVPKPAQEKPEPKAAQPQPAANPTPVAEPSPAMVLITKDGVGPVKLGAAVASLPNSVDGLYDKLEKTSREEFFEGGDSDVITVYVAKLKGKAVFEIIPDEGNVDCVNILSPELKTTHGMGLSSTPRELFSAGGHVLESNEGVAGVLCDGVLFVKIPMTKTGQKKAEQSYLGETVSFNTSDFTADGHAAKIVIASWYSD